MATGTLYLRPCADISLGHPVYPETLGAGYLAINEEVSDGKTTYIGYLDYTTEETVSCTSKFKLSFSKPTKITNVSSVRTGGYGDCYKASTAGNESKTDINFYVAGTFVASIYSWYYRYIGYMASEESGTVCKSSDADDYLTGYWYSNHELPSLVSAINDYITSTGEFPDIIVEITNSVYGGTGSSKASYLPCAYVSQLYLEVDCDYQSDIGVHHKVNGSWKAVNKAYQKQNGSWVEITGDQCKSIIASAPVVLKGG